uniref:Uncharacterized protein n=1 Tax=Arundo donax TaxID=35708 RepID=A0A0A9B8B9_ARUDO
MINAIYYSSDTSYGLKELQISNIEENPFCILQPFDKATREMHLIALLDAPDRIKDTILVPSQIASY